MFTENDNKEWEFSETCKSAVFPRKKKQLQNDSEMNVMISLITIVPVGNYYGALAQAIFICLLMLLPVCIANWNANLITWIDSLRSVNKFPLNLFYFKLSLDSLSSGDML